MTRSEQIEKAAIMFLKTFSNVKPQMTFNQASALLPARVRLDDALALPPDPAPQVKHFARNLRQAVCGASLAANESHAPLIETTCFVCLRCVALEVEKKPKAIPDAPAPVRDFSAEDMLAWLKDRGLIMGTSYQAGKPPCIMYDVRNGSEFDVHRPTISKLNDAESEIRRLRDRVKAQDAELLDLRGSHDACAELRDRVKELEAGPSRAKFEAMEGAIEEFLADCCGNLETAKTQADSCNDPLCVVCTGVKALAMPDGDLTASQRERIMSAADKIRIEIHKQDVLPRGVLMTIDSKAAEILVALYEKPETTKP